MNKYTDEQNVKIAKKEYDKLKVGDDFIEKGNTVSGKVSQTIDNRATGEQTYIVTKGGDKITANSPLSEREKVKEVIVLYRGSSAPDELAWGKPDTNNDVAADWLMNDIPAAAMILAGKGTATPQLKSSAKTLKNTLDTYPNAKTYVYAHSLGGMNGSYAIADLSKEQLKRIGGAYLYQCPNIYNLLNAEQKKIADAFTASNKGFIYADLLDFVPLGYGNNKPAVGNVLYVDGKDTGNLGKQHMWGGYQFDKEGNLKLTEAGSAKQSAILQSQSLKYLAKLKKKLSAGGGGLTSSEEKFLEASEAFVRVRTMQARLKRTCDKLEKHYKKDIEQARELWRSTLADARHYGDSLTETEIIGALADGGATEAKIKLKPIEQRKIKLSKLKEIEEAYNDVINQIQHAINEVIEKDQELARTLAEG
ncbi:hypothetical protein [Listeria valentina]|uniref:hypothetical protein n=1 Tax=Listeria valentina TaxID=2705293 RepID=UPI00142FD3F0|nr:hypothetical protein [Listeria valentina]